MFKNMMCLMDGSPDLKCMTVLIKYCFTLLTLLLRAKLLFIVKLYHVNISW